MIVVATTVAILASQVSGSYEFMLGWATTVAIFAAPAASCARGFVKPKILIFDC
jgi:hypothetical protein